MTKITPLSTASSAREKLLNAAHTLFYNYGIHESGIDKIVARAGVARKSLYNNFPSKESLILAYLALRHAAWLDLFAKREQQAASIEDRILAIFDAYADHAELDYEAGFRGCGLLNAAAEFPAGSKGRILVAQQKEEVENLLLNNLQQLMPDKPERAISLARHCAFLLEGSITRAGLVGQSCYIYQARQMAKQLVNCNE